jgi:hypothetical protein
MRRPEVEMWLGCRARQRSRRVLATRLRRAVADSVPMASVRLPGVDRGWSMAGLSLEQKRLHLVDAVLPSVT